MRKAICSNCGNATLKIAVAKTLTYEADMYIDDAGFDNDPFDDEKAVCTEVDNIESLGSYCTTCKVSFD